MSSREQEDIGKGSESTPPYETYLSRTSITEWFFQAKEI